MNCYEAVNDNGKLVFVETILPEQPENSLAAKNAIQADAFILTQAPAGGKERTEKEYKILAKHAGFERFNKVCCGSDIWIMELYK